MTAALLHCGLNGLYTTLDGQRVGNGQPGPIYQRLYAGDQQAKKEIPA